MDLSYGPEYTAFRSQVQKFLREHGGRAPKGGAGVAAGKAGPALLEWQKLLIEHGYAARNTPDHPPLAELWRAQQEIDRWFIDWSDGLSDAALDEKVNFTLIGGNPGVMTRGEILLHIVNHTSYHRGFVADLFYQVPARPPTTDIPVYLREGVIRDR